MFKKMFLLWALFACLMGASAPSMASALELDALLDSVPFGKRPKALLKAEKLDELSSKESCPQSDLRKHYSKHDVSCDWYLMKDRFVVAGVPFYAVLITNDSDEVVALSLRRTHYFASTSRPEEMSEPVLLKASEDRDHMLARNALYVDVGNIAALAGRDSMSQLAGQRSVDHYFKGAKYHAVFNERLSARADRVVINIFPAGLDEDHRGAFLSVPIQEKFYGRKKSK